jgi:UDP-glucose 4-epimerase
LTILVTGATGFVGQIVVDTLQKKNIAVKAVVRNNRCHFKNSEIITSINNTTDFKHALNDCSTAIHCAGRVHVMDDSSSNPLEEFREVNTYGTLNLAQQAADAGVKRFIFISSIKVNGESTELGFPFKPDEDFIPTDPYGLSKYEAEVGLRKIANETGMEIVIIRPPLVYGPGVKANFASLLNLASKGLPLPFACFDKNRRSMVSVDNLVDLIVTCIDHPKAANQVFLVSDDEDLSTAQLISRLSRACNKSGFLLPIPVFLFKVVARVFGKKDVIERLSGSLCVDISKTKDVLSWSPPQSVDDGFKLTAEAFLKGKL